MKRMSILFVLVLGLAAAGCGDEAVVDAGPQDLPPAKPVADGDISLLRGSVFDTPTPAGVTWVNNMPGNNEKQTPMFEGAPPVIPHVVNDFLPITHDENGCIECHLSTDPDEEAPQLPDDHKTDLRNSPDKVGQTVAGARWACVLCHVPTSDVKPFPESAPNPE